MQRAKLAIGLITLICLSSISEAGEILSLDPQDGYGRHAPLVISVGIPYDEFEKLAPTLNTDSRLHDVLRKLPISTTDEESSMSDRVRMSDYQVGQGISLKIHFYPNVADVDKIQNLNVLQSISAKALVQTGMGLHYSISAQVRAVDPSLAKPYLGCAVGSQPSYRYLLDFVPSEDNDLSRFVTGIVILGCSKQTSRGVEIEQSSYWIKGNQKPKYVTDKLVEEAVQPLTREFLKSVIQEIIQDARTASVSQARDKDLNQNGYQHHVLNIGSGSGAGNQASSLP